MTSTVLSLVPKPRKRDALLKKIRSSRHWHDGDDDDDSSGVRKRQKRKSEIQRFLEPWYKKNEDHPWFRHEEPNKRRSTDYRPAIMFDDDSDLDEENPIIRPWRMRRKEYNNDVNVVVPSVNLCRALCPPGDESSPRRCKIKAIKGEKFCIRHRNDYDRKDGTLDMRCRFKNIRYHQCGNTVHGGHDYCYAHLEPEQRTGPPKTCTSCDGKAAKKEEDRSNHRLRLYCGSIYTLQCDAMNDIGQLCPYVAVENNVFCPFHSGSTSRASVASRPKKKKSSAEKSNNDGSGSVDSTPASKSPPSNVAVKQTSVAFKPKRKSIVEGSVSSTPVLKSPRKDAAIKQTPVASNPDSSEASNKKECSVSSTAASTLPPKNTAGKQTSAESIPKMKSVVEKSHHNDEEGSVGSTSVLRSPPNAEEECDDDERKAEGAEKSPGDSEVGVVIGIVESESDQTDSSKILIGTGNEDSDFEQVEEDVEEMDERNPKKPFTYEEFERLWGLCEEDFGEKISAVEATSRIRGANTRVSSSDVKGQARAQYGRILPGATQKVIHEVLCLKKDDVFLDIGHGIGNMCIQVAFTAGCEARGIEVVYERHAVSEGLRSHMIEKATANRQTERTAFGKIDLRTGSLKDEEHRDFLTNGVTRAYVNNFNGVMGSRCDTKGIPLDIYIAGLFAHMAPGSIMVTFDPLGALERTREEANKTRARHGLEESANSSFFKFEKILLGKACNSVKWVDDSGNQEAIYLYKYERLEQPSEGAVYLCCNPKCEEARNSIPIPATIRNKMGEVVMNHCTCNVSPPNLRRKKRVNYSK